MFCSFPINTEKPISVVVLLWTKARTPLFQPIIRTLTLYCYHYYCGPSSSYFRLVATTTGRMTCVSTGVYSPPLVTTPSPSAIEAGVPCTTGLSIPRETNHKPATVPIRWPGTHSYNAKPGRQKPSKMRTCLMNLVGLSFVLAGAIWAALHSARSHTDTIGRS